MSDQCAAAAKQAKRVLGCINKGTTSRDKEVIIQLSSCQATPGILCSVLVPAIQIDMDRLERAQRRATKMIKDLSSHVRRG